MQVSSDPQTVSAKKQNTAEEADAAQKGSYAANMVAGAVAPDPQAQEVDPRVETLRGIIRNRSQQNTPQEAGTVPNSPLVNRRRKRTRTAKKQSKAHLYRQGHHRRGRGSRQSTRASPAKQRAWRRRRNGWTSTTSRHCGKQRGRRARSRL